MIANENTILIGIAAASNIIAIVKAYISFSTRLTRIEVDIKWIKANCEICPPISDQPTK